MMNTRLILGTSNSFGIPQEEQIRKFHEVGFDGFFTEWGAGYDCASYKKTGDELNMIYQSIHAPFKNAKRMWHGTYDEATFAINELISCVEDCAKFDVPLMVIHAFIGFEDHAPCQFGIDNYGKVIQRAKELGIKLAFENTEGEEYLAALMDAFKFEKNVGFCWDTGHEMCYNKSRDMMALYGDRIFGTHINDNLGVKDFGGKITYIDDLHLLPFDGIANWQNIADRLKKYNFTDTLTFELTLSNKPGRHEHDSYRTMPLDTYIVETFKRACRVAALTQF